MKKLFLPFFFIGFSFLSIPQLTYGEVTRQKNLDFIIVLDRSLSMVDKIEDVKSFFKKQILERSVIPGDSLTIIKFCGNAELMDYRVVKSDDDIKQVEDKLDQIHGDGKFTDIGNALDFTYSYVTENLKSDNRRHFVLLTDGRQEAPEGSKYASNDFSIKHPYLENAKNIQKAGWKIQIFGIGTDTEAQSLADELSGASKIWDKSESMLQDRSIHLDEELNLSESPHLTWQKGQPELRLSLDTTNIFTKESLVIKKVLAQLPGVEEPVVLMDKEFEVSLTPQVPVTLQIPLSSRISPVTLEKAQYIFQFGNSLPLTPGRFSAPSGLLFLQDFAPFIPIVTLVFLSFMMLFKIELLKGSKKVSESAKWTINLPGSDCISEES